MLDILPDILCKTYYCQYWTIPPLPPRRIPKHTRIYTVAVILICSRVTEYLPILLVSNGQWIEYYVGTV